MLVKVGGHFCSKGIGLEELSPKRKKKKELWHRQTKKVKKGKREDIQ